MSKHLIVVGGGAAGFFCAVNAARLRPGLKVTLLEKHHQVLQKVKVSGGGRCNVTHDCNRLSDLVKNYPRGSSWLKRALKLFMPADTVNWFQERGIPLHTESDGRMFPDSNNSQSIIDCLLREAALYGVELQLKTEIRQIRKTTHGFELIDQKGIQHSCHYLCLAPGGFAKSSQYDWLTALGHTFHTPVPSLFTFNIPGHPICKLMGISLPAEVKIQGSSFAEKGPVLITHWGLSGPAVLKLSARAARELADTAYHFTILVNWLHTPENLVREQWNTWRNQKAGLSLQQGPLPGIPQRLWEYLLHASGIDASTRWSELNARDQNKLIHILCTQAFDVKGKTTFKEEFVTCGGIRLEEIDALTMQSKLLPGLYFCGEILDVDGITGGFNFQHAWCSGMLSAQSIAAAV